MSAPEEPHVFPAEIQCRYILRIPELLPEAPAAAVTLHGYGSNPEEMLGFTAGLLGKGWIVAAVQAPNQHYSQGPGAGKTAYNWGVRDHWEASAALHHRMVRHVLGEVRERFAIPAARCLLAGFSQPVGLNYRFAATYPEEIGAVLAICGGVPRDWEEDKYRPVIASILHIARDEDEFYPVAVAEDFPRRLRLRAADVEFHMLPGKHRFPSQAGVVVRPWLARVFGGG